MLQERFGHSVLITTFRYDVEVVRIATSISKKAKHLHLDRNGYGSLGHAEWCQPNQFARLIETEYKKLPVAE
jgi:hypothetical protein